MKIIIKTKNVKLTQNSQKYIYEKINSLEKFSRIFQQKQNHFLKKEKPGIVIHIEIGKETLHHKKGNIFLVRCQMKLLDKIVRAEVVSKNWRQAVNQVKDILQKELKQYKEKSTSKNLRKARVFKKSFHLSPQARFWRKGRIREEGI